MKDSGSRWTVSSVSVVPDANARIGHFAKLLHRRPHAVCRMQMQPWSSTRHSSGPQPNGPELTVPASGTGCTSTAQVPSGTAKAFYNPNEHIREDFGTLRADYNLGKNDTLSSAYTIDDGTSLIPLADPLFASFTPLRMQVLSLTETHVFSPADPQYSDRWIFPRLLRAGSVPLDHHPRQIFRS